MKKIYLVEWHLSDYEPPLFSIYIQAIDEATAVKFAQDNHGCYPHDYQVTEIEVIVAH